MGLSLVPALVLSLKIPFVGASVLPRIAALLAKDPERAMHLKAAHKATYPREDYASDVDWYLVLAFPETRGMVIEFYEDSPNGAPMCDWFAAEELAQIDAMLCEKFMEIS